MPGISEAASELESIARHLRRAGDLELVRDLNTAMRRAVTPEVERAIRAELPGRLPNRYAEVLDADLAIGTSVRTGERDPGVSVTGRVRSARRRRLKRLDDGILAHPLWGNRRHWFDQPVRQGWFTGPAQDAAPRVREEIEKALDEVATRAASKEG